jgi:hypothetical protein
MTAAATHKGYNVSYRNKWWKRRRYACGNVIEAEALQTFEYLVRAGFKRVRIEPA